MEIYIRVDQVQASLYGVRMVNERTNAVYVMGHRNPDTDSICAAIGNAAFLRGEDYPEAIAARCGHMPKRTEWVLQKAGVEKPTYFRDVYPTAGSICHRVVYSVTRDSTFLETYALMDEKEFRSVPVVENGEILGIIQFMDLLRLLMPAQLAEASVRNVETSLDRIVRTLSATPVTKTDIPSEDEELMVVVAASSELSIWRRLEELKNEGTIDKVVMVCGDRSNIQRYAVELGVHSLVLTSDYLPPAEVTALAEQNGTTILSTKWDTASVGKLIRCSRKVEKVIRTDFHYFDESVRIDEIRRVVSNIRQDLFPVIETGSKKLVGVFSKSDLVDPPRVRLALVDHNELMHAVQGAEEADVVEVIDHHRLGGTLTSRQPIRFLAEPVGSTSTLVARRFFHRNREPEKGVALCLCAGILSDTINLTSPTTTDLDVQILDRLCKIAEVDPTEFMNDFFAAGSLLRQGEDSDVILNADRKEFEEYGYKISISQIEEVGLDGFSPVRPRLEAALQELVHSSDLNFACLLVTDVSHHDSLLLVAGLERIIDEIPYKRLDATLFEATGVVSRKKQFFPDLASALRRAGELQ